MLANKVLAATSSYATISLVQSGGAVESKDGAITLTGVQTNDVIFIFMVNIGTTFTAPNGYTQVNTGTLSATSPGYYWRYYYKVMGATPDTSISVGETNNDGTAFTFYALRNVNTTTPILTSAVATGTTNPPAVTTDRKSMILVGGFGGNSASSAFTAAPTNYTNFLTQDATSNADANPAMALRSFSYGLTEDPGAWTGTLNWAGQVGLTLAVNPKLL